ncbi:hypothetical protein WALSEDRAFT_63603 [Wallemia mellicola CBS 633.66]|uniref:Uncharacterized protein n=1 Tax=Wallemia mellicola (strain ATCC MYA-4683 / CBS 633.66) TaxID=671144 RepID=I4YEK9_WALMC|nr:hypothetical protein WALSEDRAFT_63603 [Wallemia mellicola CBS 633.66]EIM22401.1 hypothetical protein WALSEDRAFT_63603 [Wallemia mellicola CBS 633.66]|eukprot:XP_006957648.1 hypothetical protein WALSEDRAFT_63603 [Wallemia mellicola CBS 633.66]
MFAKQAVQAVQTVKSQSGKALPSIKEALSNKPAIFESIGRVEFNGNKNTHVVSEQ